MIVTARREAKGAKRRTLASWEPKQPTIDIEVSASGATSSPDGRRFFIDWYGTDEHVVLSLSEAEAQHILSALGARITGG